MTNACLFGKKLEGTVYSTAEHKPYSILNTIIILLALTWNSSINTPTTIKNKVNYFGYMTYTLDPQFLNAGIPKKHILLTHYRIQYFNSHNEAHSSHCKDSHIDFKKLYAPATYCFTKHLFGQ